jgi:hypothetical protein
VNAAWWNCPTGTMRAADDAISVEPRPVTGTGGLGRHVLGSQRFNLAPIRLPSTYRHSRRYEGQLRPKASGCKTIRGLPVAGEHSPG